LRKDANGRSHRSGLQGLRTRIEAQKHSHFDPFGHRLATGEATAALRAVARTDR
jgi:hypothetical protein